MQLSHSAWKTTIVYSHGRSEFFHSDKHKHGWHQGLLVYRLIPLILLMFLLISGWSNNLMGQYPRVSIPEIAQTADVIVLGTPGEQTSRVNEQESLIVTDFRLTDYEIIHQSEQAEIPDNMQFTYAGGQVGEIGLWVSESPSLQTNREYVLFLHADGELYLNPVTGGQDGLYKVYTDSVSGDRYVLNAAGQGILGAHNRRFLTTDRSVAGISAGEIHWADQPDESELRTEEPPISETEGHQAVFHQDPEPSGNIWSLGQFIDYIRNQALLVEVSSPVLRYEGEGVMVVQEEGEWVGRPLPQGKEFGFSGGLGKQLKELREEPEHGSKTLPFREQSGTEPDHPWITGQPLNPCGYQNLPIAIEQFDGQATSNQEALDIWNMFMSNAYTMTSDDGTFGKNDENEYTGFVSNNTLDNVYGKTWDGALAKTLIWTKFKLFAGNSCNEILETDVIHNPAYSWSDSLDPIINDTLVYSYRNTTMHEIGHTWGWQDGVDEQYDYDHPSVMHAGWRCCLLEDGWGIHAVDAKAFRDHYDNQTSEEDIIDIGIESYYANDGLNRAVPGKSTGDTTRRFQAGDQILLQGITVENMSTQNLDVSVEFFLSKDRQLSGNDIQIGSFQWGSQNGTLVQLLGETYFSGDFTVNIPLDTPGDLYYIMMRANPVHTSDDFTRNNVTSMFRRIRVEEVPTISGNVFHTSTGGIEGVRLLGFPDDVYTDVNGDYVAAVPEGWNGTIQPDHSAYDFLPSDASFNNVTTDQNQDFRGILKRYDITGYIYSSTGMPVEDVELTGFPGTVTTDQSGTFQVTVDHGFSGTIIPVKIGYNFTPDSESLNRVTSDLSLSFTAVPGQLADSDWPMFRQDQNHSGYLETEPIEGREQWAALLQGDVVSSPAVDAQGNIYIAALNGVYAYDENGNEQWDFVISQVKHFRSSPAVGAGPVIYIGSTDGSLYAIDHEGDELWQFTTGDSIVSSPVVGNSGVVYIGSDSDNLYAVNSDGSQRWAFPTNGEIKSSPAFTGDGVVYVGSDDGNIYAVDTTGAQVWTVSTGDKVRSSPALAIDGTVYIGSDDGKLYSIDQSGAVNWAYDVGSPIRSSPAIGEEGTIYFGADNGTLYALNPDQSLAWSYQTGDAIRSSPAVSYFSYQGPGGDRELVYVGSDDGSVYAVTSMNTGNSQISPGDLEWSIDTGSPVRSSPALDGNMLYIGSNDYNLHALGGGSSASGMFAALGLGGMEGIEEIAILIAESREGGLFGEPAITGGLGEDDGCTGGPLIIPLCGPQFVSPGEISKFVDIRAGVPLRIGIMPAGRIDEYEMVLNNETTDPLIAEFTTIFKPGESFVATFAGLGNTGGFMDNPAGRDISMDLKVRSGVSPRPDNPVAVQVLAGNFVTDAENVRISLVESETRFKSLGYGEYSQLKNVQPGVYTVRISTEDEGLGKAAVLREYRLDLTTAIGQTVTLFANGFLHPDRNHNGPSMTLMSGSTTGQSMDLGVEASRTSLALMQLAPVFQDDYLLEPGESHSIRYTDFTNIGYGAWWGGFLMPYHSTSIGQVIREHLLPAVQSASWAVPHDAISFNLTGTIDEGWLQLRGQPSDSLPEILLAALEMHNLSDYTHISRLSWGQYQGGFGDLSTWYVMDTQNGIALPVAKYQELTLFGVTQPMLLTLYKARDLAVPESMEAGSEIRLNYSLQLFEITDGLEIELIDSTSYRFRGMVETRGTLSLPQPNNLTAEMERAYRIRMTDVEFGTEYAVLGKSTADAFLLLHPEDEGYELVASLAGTDEAEQFRVKSGYIYSVAGIMTDIGPEQDLPETVALHPNFPNPFNPSTRIRYEIPEAQHVLLNVYDIKGYLVETLVDMQQNAGKYEVMFSPDGLPSGLYLYRLQTGKFSDTGQMLFLK